MSQTDKRETVFQLELIRQITFWSLFIVSAFLSVNLYIGLVEGLYFKLFMVVVAVTIEGLKILTLTMANTARWQSTQHRLNHLKESMLGFFTRTKRKTIRDPELLRDVMDASKKSTRAAILYFWYVFIAFVSIAASFGFIMQTVNEATTHALTTTNSDTISVYRDTLTQYDSQIKENQNTVAQNSKAIDQYNKLISGLDPNSATFDDQRIRYQANINNYEKANLDLQKSNTDLQNKKLDLNDKIQNYKLQDVQTTRTSKKTMYQLMGEVLAIPDKAIMFVLLYMLAILIEVGIFICSPHFHRMDSDFSVSKLDFKPVKRDPQTTLEKELQKEDFRKAFEKETVSLEQSERRAKEYADLAQVPEIVQAAEVAQEILKVQPEVVAPVEQVKASVESSKTISDTNSGHSSVKAIVIPGEKKEEIPVRPGMKPSDFENYIDALISNEDKAFLRDKYTAADVAKISRPLGLRFFDYLQRTKPYNNVPLVQFRPEVQNWFANYPLEFIKAFVNANFGKREVT